MRVRIAQIQCAMAEVFGITRADIIGPSREAKIAHPRALAMAAAREITGASFPMLGRAFGNRHHTTIISGVKRSHNLIDAFPDYYDKVQPVKDRFKPQP